MCAGSPHRWNSPFSSSRTMSPVSNVSSSWLTDVNWAQASRSNAERFSLAMEQINRWRDLLTLHHDQGVPLATPLLMDLTNFLGQLQQLIRRLSEANIDLCVFCRNNNETFEMYSSHKVKDRLGRVTCPVLRRFVCPRCSATGDFAHTIKYCPLYAQNPLLPNTSDNRLHKLNSAQIPETPSQRVPRLMTEGTDTKHNRSVLDQLIVEMYRNL